MKSFFRISGLSLLITLLLSVAASSCSSGGSVHRKREKKERTVDVGKKKDHSKDKKEPKKILKEQRKELLEQFVKNSDLSDDRKQLLAEAIEWLGTPYKYGKQEKLSSTDCSGFTMMVYLQVLEMKIPRNSAKQAEFCKSLKTKHIKGGDLVFFATGSDPQRVSHVGMMLDEVSFIHASSSKGVVVSRMDNPWYAKRLVKYGRVPGVD